MFAEALKIANQVTDKTDIQRGMFAASLARVDLPAAEAIVRDFKDGGNPSTILGNMALSLAELSPTDAERLWLQTEGRGRLAKMDPVLCWKLAGIDPAGAVRIIEGWPIHQTRPQCYFYLALGAKARDQAISRQSFRAGLQGLDRIMDERPERYNLTAARLLPVVEQIDPALVPEIFWRHIASRQPYGDPRTSHAAFPGPLVEELAAYDREVAAALFAQTLARMEQTEPKELATWGWEFLAWSAIDPRVAVARLERTPIALDGRQPITSISARIAVAKSLARTRTALACRRRRAQVIFCGEPTF